jgi:hypothetical protein
MELEEQAKHQRNEKNSKGIAGSSKNMNIVFVSNGDRPPRHSIGI